MMKSRALSPPTQVRCLVLEPFSLFDLILTVIEQSKGYSREQERVRIGAQGKPNRKRLRMKAHQKKRVLLQKMEALPRKPQFQPQAATLTATTSRPTPRPSSRFAFLGFRYRNLTAGSPCRAERRNTLVENCPSKGNQTRKRQRFPSKWSQTRKNRQDAWHGRKAWRLSEGMYTMLDDETPDSHDTTSFIFHLSSFTTRKTKEVKIFQRSCQEQECDSFFF